jgi:hypothetical protein
MPLPRHELFKLISLRFWVSPRRGPQLYPKLAALYGLLSPICAGENDLHRVDFPADKLDLASCPPIYLRPVNDEAMIPILRFSYNLKAKTPELGLRVILLKEIKGRIRSLGYRLEASHGPGAHPFFHSQFVNGFDKNDTSFHSSMPEWLPQTQPSFCLDANDLVHLFVVCFVSLYGKVEWSQQIAAETRLAKELRTSLRHMHVFA